MQFNQTILRLFLAGMVVLFQEGLMMAEPPASFLSIFPFHNAGKIDVLGVQKQNILLQQEAKLTPLSSDVHLYLGMIYGLEGVFDKAFSEYSQTIRLDRNKINGYIGQGDIFWRKKLWDDAIREYFTGVFRLPYSLVYQRLIEACEQRGQTKEVLAYLLKWEKTDPLNSFVHFKLGNIDEKNGKKEDALKEYGKITREAMEYYLASQSRERLGVSRVNSMLTNSDISRAPLVYEMGNRRDPFQPLFKQIEPTTVDIKNLKLTGIVESETGSQALFKNIAKPSVVYVLRNGKLYAKDNKRVGGVTGILEDNEAILTQGDKEIHLRLDEGEGGK